VYRRTSVVPGVLKNSLKTLSEIVIRLEERFIARTYQSKLLLVSKQAGELPQSQIWTTFRRDTSCYLLEANSSLVFLP
jgi:hypothetical protein